jgi:aconitate hydratase
MDARSIAATAINQGALTPATDIDVEFTGPKYFFDKDIYGKRVYDGWGKADPSEELRLGPNIKDWPVMPALTDNLVLKFCSVIHDPVTTTDELIPSGETSSYRSNPIGLAEFTLSRKDPEYVGRAKEFHKVEIAREEGGHPCEIYPDIKPVMTAIKEKFPGVSKDNTGFGSTIYAVKPGDGSAREQAASCQKVLGGWANIANEYATKRYRSNLINWGMLPFVIAEDAGFEVGDYVFVPDIKKAVEEKTEPTKIEAVKKAEITIDEFDKMQLEIGEIMACEEVPKSKKLLCSQVKVAGRTLQIVSGIKKFYSPEDMVGKKVVVITNLEPAKLAGVVSEGMLLCAEDDEGRLALLTADKDVPAGSMIS